VNISGYRRTTSTCLIVIGLAVAGPPAPAAAAPTIAFKITATAIPGFPGTGDMLGAGAVLEARGTISGTEYGGSPAPVTGLRFYAPAGTKLDTRGFASCAPSVIEADGPEACPRNSSAGPKGSAVGVVSFGGERVHETASLQPLFAPGGSLELFVDGTTPTSVEVLGTGHVVSSSPPFGPEIVGEVPLIETVPGGLDASLLEGTISIGAAYKRGQKTISYITMPHKCPPGGLPTKAQLSFLGGTTAEASYTMPCPRR
jgi:hypothetical protein